MGLGGVISNLISSVGKLLPFVTESVQAPSSSSSSSPVEGDQIEAELKALMRMLERIKATLYDAEGRQIMDLSVKLWLKELKEVTYNAEDILDDYNYEVLRAQVEARDVSQPDSRKRKLIQMPDGMFDQIKQIKDMFEETEKHRIALRLSDNDGPRFYNSELQIAPTGHFVKESNIFGREMEKEELITMLSSNCDERKVVYVVTIVGTGGLGKTTLAQLVYNDKRMKERFDAFGWICVSEDFNVQRLTREAIESITGESCDLKSQSALQNKISEVIRWRKVLLVLDDVWNENSIRWESFQELLISAKEIRILVTTRNESVAKIMQTVQTYKLGYMSKEQCWQLFKHYAFGEVNKNEDPNFIEFGIKILEKCGKLPLAIKSIASVLRHETEEEAWIDILESEIWNSDKLCNDIFTPLQLSYTHLPTYLKPCFLYCSLFPKNYTFTVKKLVELWISQGYIESNRKKSAKKIGQEYAMQLWRRSIFEGNCEETKFQMAKFKLHDMVHDLARLNSGNECYSIEEGEVLDFPEKLYHLYINVNVSHLNPLPSVKFTDVRTLIIDRPRLRSRDLLLLDIEFSEANKLRALKSWLHDINCDLKHLRYLKLRYYCPLPESLFSLYFLKFLNIKNCDIEDLPYSIGKLVSLEKLTIHSCESLQELPTEIGSLKNLQTLTISFCNIKGLPESIGNLVSLEELTIDSCVSLQELPTGIGSLKNLRTLTLSFCDIKEFPKSIGNVISLEELTIDSCISLQEIPTEIGSLKKLRTLKICGTGVNSLPPSLNKIIGNIQTFHVGLKCQKIGWLKDIVNLKGFLFIEGLRSIVSVADAQCANLVSMHNLECLMLSWEYRRVALEDDFEDFEWSNQLHLCLTNTKNPFLYDKDHCLLMEGLQPHPNLRELHISDYPGTVFPDWIGNPNSCASLVRIVIEHCENLESLTFGSLSKLKYLKVGWCYALQFLGEDSLPLQLQELKIIGCWELISLHAIKNLTSLVKLQIIECMGLHSLMMAVEQTLSINESLHENCLLGLRNLISLRSLKITDCHELQAFENEPRPVESCEVEIMHCPGLIDWCSHHNIPYEHCTLIPWPIPSVQHVPEAELLADQ